MTNLMKDEWRRLYKKSNKTFTGYEDHDLPLGLTDPRELVRERILLVYQNTTLDERLQVIARTDRVDEMLEQMLEEIQKLKGIIFLYKETK